MDCIRQRSFVSFTPIQAITILSGGILFEALSGEIVKNLRK